MAKYDLVLIDADNTLLDFDMAEEIALEKTFEHYGFDYSNEILKKYRKINSFMWKEFEHGRMDKAILQVERFSRLIKECNLKAEAVDFNKTYLSFLSEGGNLIDGALEVCRELSCHCTIAIVTNGISTTQRNRLKCSAIAPYIKYIIVSEDAGYNKPHEGFFQYTFDVCGWLDKEKAIIIGDSLNADIKGGADFGITTCWYNPTNVNSGNDIRIDYEIKNLRELPGIVL